MPGLLYGLYLVGALHGEAISPDQIGEEHLRQLEDSGLSALTTQEFPIEDLVRLFVLLQPSAAVLYVLLKIVLGYALARYLGLWTGVVALPPPPPVREWRLWEQMIWFLVGGVALWLLPWDGVLNTLAVNIVVVAIVLYAVQGFSVARYCLWRMQGRATPGVRSLHRSVDYGMGRADTGRCGIDGYLVRLAAPWAAPIARRRGGRIE